MISWRTHHQSVDSDRISLGDSQSIVSKMTYGQQQCTSRPLQTLSEHLVGHHVESYDISMPHNNPLSTEQPLITAFRRSMLVDICYQKDDGSKSQDDLWRCLDRIGDGNNVAN